MSLMLLGVSSFRGRINFMTARQMHVDLSAVLSIKTIAILDCFYTVIIIRRCAHAGGTKFND